ncbi:exodeoxyribonuclease VII large subunit [Brachybacterium sp. Z12]|uniref:exodeoxyribonuclease VII large subunit n=1 Tax=Brachybacterium sp. Z12 TaxID=2759167 RepID=UPI00292A57A7|nr:exodeoxyribonuclease VII large subunit [Brachybacterium sp. Z12]
MVAGARTPIVSAIGHEVDTPLIDLAADVRASTPTDAAKRVVPDIQAEIEQLDLGRTRLRSAIRARIEREQSALDAMRSRPVLENPSTILAGRADEIRSRISLARTLIGSRLDRAADEVDHLGRQVRSLSPLATLERGYAVVQDADGTIIRAPEHSAAGQALSVRVAGAASGWSAPRPTPTPRLHSPSRPAHPPPRRPDDPEHQPRERSDRRRRRPVRRRPRCRHPRGG